MRWIPLLALAVAAEAFAGPVAVDPGGWAWSYDVGPYKGVSGARQLLLAPGEHEVRLGPSAAFTITVDRSGLVMSSHAAARGGMERLSLRTVPVHVRPAAFTGGWALWGTSERAAGDQVVDLVPGLDYALDIGSPWPLPFFLEHGGRLDADHPGLVAAGRALELSTVDVDVRVGAYAGSWSVGEGGPANVGDERVALVRGSRTRVRAGEGDGFWLDVAADGTVDTVDSPTGSTGPVDAALVTGDVVALRTVEVHVAPDRGASAWQWAGSSSPTDAAATVSLVPDAALRLVTGRGTTWVTVTADCDVSPATVVSEGARYRLECSEEASTADAQQ